MLKNSFRPIRSSRKSVTPVIDTDEVEDEQRRDSTGRKRVPVIQCLLESSSDENDETDFIPQNSTNILWLTFTEISHIRTVLASLKLNQDKQSFSTGHDQLCFRCRKSLHSLAFLPSFLRTNHTSICSVCQQNLCRKCSMTDFSPPLPKHLFPVRIQTLIQFSSTTFDNESHVRGTTICYDCSQIFSPYTRSSTKPVLTEPRPPFDLNLTHSVHNDDRSTQNGDDQIAKTTASFNLLSTRL